MLFSACTRFVLLVGWGWGLYGTMEGVVGIHRGEDPLLSHPMVLVEDNSQTVLLGAHKVLGPLRYMFKMCLPFN